MPPVIIVGKGSFKFFFHLDWWDDNVWLMTISRSPIVSHLAASTLIVVSCLCLGTEGVLGLTLCAEDKASLQPLGQIPVPNQPTSGNQDSPNSGDSQHDCFCCCRHIIPTYKLQQLHSSRLSIVALDSTTTFLSTDCLPPDHPPRS